MSITLKKIGQLIFHMCFEIDMTCIRFTINKLISVNQVLSCECCEGHPIPPRAYTVYKICRTNCNIVHTENCVNMIGSHTCVYMKCLNINIDVCTIYLRLYGVIITCTCNLLSTIPKSVKWS